MGHEPIGRGFHSHSFTVGGHVTNFYRSQTLPPLDRWENKPGEGKVTYFEVQS